MVKIFMKKVKHKWLITMDNSMYIKNLFSYANIIEWGFRYGMTNVNNNKTSLGKELFIANYDIKEKDTNLFTFKNDNINNLSQKELLIKEYHSKIKKY